MTLEIEIRAATAADTDFAREAHHAAYRDVVERQFGRWDEERQDSFFADSWDANPHDLILVDGIPCGYWSVEHRTADIHLRELVIHPAAQGHGLGTEVLRRLQRQAADRDIPIRLGTHHENRARRLYVRLGFRYLGSFCGRSATT
jgi:ribosomal protein S18 acetylase RimI-like enzyme